MTTITAARVAPTSGIRSKNRDDHGEGEREVGADDPERDPHDRAGDQADHEVAGDVAADRAVDISSGALPARTGGLRKKRHLPANRARALDEHEQGEEHDRDQRDDAGEHALRDAEPALRYAEYPAGAPLLDRLLDAIDDLVVALEEPERPLAGRQVGDETRDRLDEVLHLGDEGRDRDVGEPADHQHRDHEHEQRRERTVETAPLEELDHGVERGGEDHRCEQPEEDSPELPGEEDRPDGEQREREHEQDRAGANRDDPLGAGHGPKDP